MSKIEDLVEAAEPNPPLVRIVMRPLLVFHICTKLNPRSSQVKAEFLGPEARGFETASIRFNTGKPRF